MIIDYDGQQYPFDFDDITVKQALAIEKYMGCSFADWGTKVAGGSDLRARQAVGWLILHPDGGVPLEDTDFKMVKLGKAIDKALAAEEQPAETGPVPTAAASTGPTPDAAAASSPAS